MSTKVNKVIAFSFSQVVTLLINFLVSPYLSRALPKPQYAVFNQVLIIIGLISVLFSFGLQAVVFYFFSKKDQDNRKIIGSLQFLILLVAVLSAIGLLIVSFLPGSLFNSPDILVYLRSCFLSVFFIFLNNYLISVLIYNDKAKQLAVITVLTSVFSVTFIFVFLNTLGLICTALLFSHTLSPLFGLLINSFLTWKYLNAASFVNTNLSYKKIITNINLNIKKV